MASNTYISTIEDLHTWFKALKTPTWNLYRGWHEKMPVHNIIYKQTEEDMDPDSSFEVLRQMMEMNAGQGGKFTVYVNNAQKGSSILVGLNLDRMRTSTAISGYSPGGFGMVPQDEVDRKINQALEIHTLRREIDDLRAEQEAGMGFKEILMEKLREVDLGPLVSGLANFLQPRPGAIQGMPQSRPATAPSQSEDEETSSFNYDGERIIVALDRIRPQFEKEEDFYNFLDRVSTQFAVNPDLKNMI